MKKFPTTKISCLLISALATVCFIAVVLVFLAATKIRFESGGYSIDQVIVTTNPEDKQPANYPLVFRPSDTIYCTVRTIGVDGIVGMRWFLGDEIISEGTGKTEGNSISSFIKGSLSEGLPEGNYHVEVFIVEDQPIETIYFEVKNQSTP